MLNYELFKVNGVPVLVLMESLIGTRSVAGVIGLHVIDEMGNVGENLACFIEWLIVLAREHPCCPFVKRQEFVELQH